MYKILGGDGKEYGPVPAETLRQWVNEGRANAQTQVQPEGGSGWTAMGQVPEFAAQFSAPPPPMSGMPAPFNAGAPDASQAAAMVNGPAIGLIITAILGAMANLVAIAMNVFGLSFGADRGQQPPEMAWVNMFSGTIGIISAVVALIMAGVIVLGALKMRKLESHGFAMTAVILAMVPCTSPCCLLGLPIGIWALVVLMKPEVKAAFQKIG